MVGLLIGNGGLLLGLRCDARTPAVADEGPDIGENCAVAASVGDSVAVSRMAIESEGFWYCCDRFGDIAVVPLFGGSSGSVTSLGDMS